MASLDLFPDADAPPRPPRDQADVPGDRGGAAHVEPEPKAFDWLRRATAFDRGFVLRRLLAGSDLLALTIAWVAATRIGPPVDNGATDAIIFVGLLPVWIVIANALGLYHLPDRRLGHSVADELGPIAVAVTLWSWVVMLVRAAVESGSLVVEASVVLWLLLLATVAGFRTLTRVFARRRSWYRQRVVVLGSKPDVQKVIRRLERHEELGLEVASVIETDADADSPTGRLDGSALAPAVAAAVAETRIDRVVVATPPGEIDERSDLIRALSALKVNVDLVSADVDAIPSRGSLHYIEGLPLLTIPIARKPRSRVALKRLLDLVIGFVALILLSPVIAYCAIRVRLDSRGPILFKQRRVGRGGKQFEMLKFRTMVVEADRGKPELSDAVVLGGDPDVGTLFKLRGDPRLTGAGDTLRRWSLDELPQLWNVVRGEMSLVGPRPLVPEEAAMVTGHYETRFTARPGMTGPWQTSGRSEIGFEDMVKLDYTYVSNWTITDDLQLLVRTVRAVVSRHGAY